MSFYFALTRWTLFDATFIGLDNFRQFFSEQALRSGLWHTVVYAVVTSGLKVVLGHAPRGPADLRASGCAACCARWSSSPCSSAPSRSASPSACCSRRTPAWSTPSCRWFGHLRARLARSTRHTALLSVALVDVWKGVGLATVIYIAGVLSIPQDYYEAVDVDGGGAWHKFRNVTLPLSRPATFTVILLSFIGGLRSFDLIWTMTGGGPGFSSDVIASVIYKEYQAGFFGLATAGQRRALHPRDR